MKIMATLRARIVDVVEETSSMEREYFSGSLDRATSSTKLKQENSVSGIA